MSGQPDDIFKCPGRQFKLIAKPNDATDAEKFRLIGRHIRHNVLQDLVKGRPLASKSTLYSLVQTQKKARQVKAKEKVLQRKLQMLEQRRAMLEVLLRQAEAAEKATGQQTSSNQSMAANARD
jgi:hypothetical protein